MENDNQENQQKSYKKKKDNPKNRRPSLHNIPIQNKLLHDSLVSMCELQP